MNLGVIYTISAIICMLQTLIILNRTLVTKHKEMIDRKFCQMLCTFAVFSFVDAGWGICDAFSSLLAGQIFTIFGYLYHIMAAAAAFIWVRYMIYYTKIEKREHQVLTIISIILFLVQLLIIIANVWNHNLFYVDEQGTYITGKMRIYVYCIQYMYYLMAILYALMRLIQCRQKRKMYLTVIIFSFIPLCCGILQYCIFDAAMYSLGFMFSAFIIYAYTVTEQRENFLEELYYSLDQKQSSIIQALAGDFEAIYYVDYETGCFDTYYKSEDGTHLVSKQSNDNDYFTLALSYVKKHVILEDQKKMENFLKKKSIMRTLKMKNNCEIVIRINLHDQIKYFKYRYVNIHIEGESEKIVVGVYDVDDEVRNEMKKQEEMRIVRENEILLKNRTTQLTRDANTDELTGLMNRRAYEKAMKTYQETMTGDDIIYISMDLNCLKTVNDTLGHEAGDELLKAAAFCMQKTFETYGNIYRIGGDEFAALIFIESDELEQLFKRFEETQSKWKGSFEGELAISYGYVRKMECPNLTIYQIAKLADKKMYQHKAKFYAARGIDRRGQEAAFDAVCRTYTKILKVNLTKDTYSTIQTQNENLTNGKECAEHISDRLLAFAKSGVIHKDDVENFMEKTDIDYLRDYFKKDNLEFCIHYRKLVGKKYKKTMLQMIPVRENMGDELIVYLYVKDIDR